MTCPNCKLTSGQIGVGTIKGCEGPDCFYHPEGKQVQAFKKHVEFVGSKLTLEATGYDKPDIDEVVNKIIENDQEQLS